MTVPSLSSSIPTSKLLTCTSAQGGIKTMGYADPAYAKSLSEFGVARTLPRSGGLILQRQIPNFPYADAMGCYPLFSCQDWSQLENDLDDLEDKLVSLSLVTDPFGDCDPTHLKRCFPDKVVPFKEHFIVDLSRSVSDDVHPHHRRNAGRALHEVDVERCADASQYLNEWHELYTHLIEKHQIKGLTAFSKTSFDGQLRVPGLVAFRATREGKTVGMILWYVQDKVAYYHLGAYSDLGYSLRASFALFWRAIEYFGSSGLRWLNLGAGAGLNGQGTDGLSRFKRGWSNGTRTAYFCGRILAPDKYAEIIRAKNVSATDYFPAYRNGEYS